MENIDITSPEFIWKVIIVTLMCAFVIKILFSNDDSNKFTK